MKAYWLLLGKYKGSITITNSNVLQTGPIIITSYVQIDQKIQETFWVVHKLRTKIYYYRRKMAGKHEQISIIII